MNALAKSVSLLLLITASLSTSSAHSDDETLRPILVQYDGVTHEIVSTTELTEVSDESLIPDGYDSIKIGWGTSDDWQNGGKNIYYIFPKFGFGAGNIEGAGINFGLIFVGQTQKGSGTYDWTYGGPMIQFRVGHTGTIIDLGYETGTQFASVHAGLAFGQVYANAKATSDSPFIKAGSSLIGISAGVRLLFLKFDAGIFHNLSNNNPPLLGISLTGGL